jgi:hypothetical protein
MCSFGLKSFKNKKNISKVLKIFGDTLKTLKIFFKNNSFQL